MHTGALDVVQAGNGAAQFALETTAITGRLHELAGTQPLFLVEDFETDVAVGRRDTRTGELETCASKIIRLDQQGAGVRFDGIGDIRSGEGFHHLIGIHPRQAAEQRTIIGLLRPEHHGKTDRHAGRQPDQQADLPQHGHIRKVFQKGQAQQGLLDTLGSSRHRNVHRFSHDSIRLTPASA